ncbi:MAG: hypothetical protein GY820_31750 [Gammaproteobacteria bacterium]|nr:hypothetical protein [Gammaproteobacteria bacterium]
MTWHFSPAVGDVIFECRSVNGAEISYGRPLICSASPDQISSRLTNRSSNRTVPTAAGDGVRSTMHL